MQYDLDALLMAIIMRFMISFGLLEFHPDQPPRELEASVTQQAPENTSA
jgi:hypothetical protein